MLLASDAVHFYEEFERDMPFTAISDLPAMYEAFAIIREEIRERGLTVIAGHDPDVLARFRACEELPHGSLNGMTPKRYWENWTQENQLAIA
ncbi:hypothetical protein [Arthrobacter sp. MMS18-M83]|uniref:hypothetical protein n=1 Tax=Arthrobacter sp. MMS18-M83 TaxID=2996261 RepID=UPI00227C532F|nr:hypothetical protein [Arthrobacter sp. MMS18-M83]WAH96202.1 hypothetical protein OW521_17500 [Arthrobacter sp. MMS18-M83]